MRPRLGRRAAGHQVHDRDRVVARLLPEDVAHERQVLDGVAVGVDDRMVEARADRGDLVAGKELHGAILALACDARPMDPNDPRVRLERNGNVAVVTLDDPARRNALSLEVTVQLGQAVDEASADPSVGALVLTATPPAFCAGGSVDDLLNPRASLRDMYAGVLALAADHPAVGGGGERTGDRRGRQPPARRAT